jgi:hypothetical protein
MQTRHIVKINGRLHEVRTKTPNGNLVLENGMIANPRTKRIQTRHVLTGKFISLEWR